MQLSLSNDSSGSLSIFSESRLQRIQTPGSHPDVFVSYSTSLQYLVLCGVDCCTAVPLALTGLPGVLVFQYPIKAHDWLTSFTSSAGLYYLFSIFLLM